MPGACDLMHAGIDDPRVNVDLVKHEVVGEFASTFHGCSCFAGKSFVFVVTMTWAPLVIAAASTCRSSGSGNSSAFDQRLIAGDQAVRDCAVHQLPQPDELLRRECQVSSR